MTMTTNEFEALTAGLKAPMHMNDKDWDHLSRSLHTDAMVRMLQAGDWMSVDPHTGEVLVSNVSPETTQWHTRGAVNMMLQMSGKNVDTYLADSITKFRQHFAKEIDGGDTVNSMAFTYGFFSDGKTLMGIRWIGFLTKDFGVVVRAMEHSMF